MKKMDSSELKKYQVGILDYVHEFCVKNNIKYFIDSGTLLGAVRHGGYIPWDDDIDVGMLREEYDVFREKFTDETGRYVFASVETDKKCPFAHGKVYDTHTVLYEPDERGRKLAVNIDVFVYDDAPEDDALLEEQYKKRDIYRYLNNRRTGVPASDVPFKTKVVYYTFHYVLKVFPFNFFTKMVSKNSQRYKGENTSRVGNFTAYTKMICSKRVFDEFIDIEFEGKKYRAPKGYDEWLRAFYGDYMELPPEEKRVSTHRFVAYSIE